MIGLVEDMADFRVHHQLPLVRGAPAVPVGFQTSMTPSADDPIYVALRPAPTRSRRSQGFNPGVGADLYTTNGEFTDWAHGEAGVLAWTPELCEAASPTRTATSGSSSRTTKVRSSRSSSEPRLRGAAAKSATDPDDPVSPLRISRRSGLLPEHGDVDPQKSNWIRGRLRVDVSYAGGSSQPRRGLGEEGRSDRSRSTTGSTAGRPRPKLTDRVDRTAIVYGGQQRRHVYYRYLRGRDPGASRWATSVEYWFTGGG